NNAGDLTVNGNVAANAAVTLSIAGAGSILVDGAINAGSGPIDLTNDFDLDNDLTVTGLIETNGNVTLTSGDTAQVTTIGTATPAILSISATTIRLTGDVSTI